MGNTSNIRHLFNMDERQFATYRRKLQDLVPSAESMRVALNKPEAEHLAGRLELGIAVGTLIGSLLVSMLFADDSAWRFAIIVPGILVAYWYLLVGRQKWLHARSVRHQAKVMMRALEGAGGLLWRFETFLVDYDNSLPEPVRESLPAICRASRAGTLQDDHLALRDYWYWISDLEGRMDVIESPE